METSRRRYTKVCGEQEQLDFHYSNVIDQNQRQSRFAGHESGLTRKECVGQQLESIPYATNRSSMCDNIVAERKKMAGNSIPPTHMRSNDADVQANHCANEEDNYKGISLGHDIMSDNSKNDSECSNSSDSICYKNDKSPMHSDEEVKRVSPSDELATKILKQAEDVFDDFNILKDTFLQKYIRRSKEGYISIRFLASFRKIKALTKNWQDVKYSLQKSKKLVLNENGTKVRRIDPIPTFKDTPYARTVVVFNLSTDKIAIEDVQELMLLYGDVVKVSIVDPDMDVPEICSTRFLTYFKAFVEDKSFAIVEFHNYESAETAISNLKNEENNPDQIKIVPLISDEYRNQSKPSSRKQSTIREKGDVNSKELNKNTRMKRSTRNKGKYTSQRSKEGTSEAENSSSSSDHQCNTKSNQFRSTEEETEFIPPTDELARKVAKQAEDWFDDFSIFKTTFLLNHIRRSKDGFISIKLMASSRKLRALTKDWRAVKYSIRNSTKLELNERETKVRRVDPIPNFEDTKYAKTVVVFNLPMEDADAESVNRLMSLYGSVASFSIISPKSVIPDICTNRFLLIHDKFVKDKTFAIVEYQEYASAVKAIMEHGDINVDGDDEKLKVVPLMSDAYKNRSNPSTSKSSKTGASSNESRDNKKNSQSINRKTFRKRQMYSANDTQSSTRDQDDAKLMGKRNPSLSYMKLSPTGRSHQSSTHSFERGSKAKINNNTSSVFSQEDGAYQDTYGAHAVFRQTGVSTGGSPIYRNRSNQRVNQNLSPSTQRGSKFSNPVHPTIYETNNLGLYWKKNSRFALDNRMFPRTPYNDFPPYPGNALSMQSHASRWPTYPDTTNRFCGRSQNDSFWFNRSDLLTREYERWKAEFNNAAQFSTISSHM